MKLDHLLNYWSIHENFSITSCGYCDPNPARQFFEGIPPYPILSHTWGTENAEVSFQVVQQNTGYGKPSAAKIKFFQQLAAADNLEYCWIDTCCIDQSSSQERNEALNSMVGWYRNAARCYVTLSDVYLGGVDEADRVRSAEDQLRRCRWFARAWTLQDLIAPSWITFLSADHFVLGDKVSLEHVLHKITKVPVEALRGGPPSTFSIDERLSWRVVDKPLVPKIGILNDWHF